MCSSSRPAPPITMRASGLAGHRFMSQVIRAVSCLPLEQTFTKTSARNAVRQNRIQSAVQSQATSALPDLDSQVDVCDTTFDNDGGSGSTWRKRYEKKIEHSFHTVV